MYIFKRSGYISLSRKIVGYSVSSFGLGILASSSIYPLGYLDSKEVFNGMMFVGNILIVTGLFIRPKYKKGH